MNDFIILAELILLIVLYVLILFGYNKIYSSYQDRKNKLEVLSADDDVTILPIEKRKYSQSKFAE